MSFDKLPANIEKEIDRTISSGGSPHGFTVREAILEGAHLCYLILLERAPEFDEKAVSEAGNDLGHKNYHGRMDDWYYNDVFVESARWQHEQLAAQIAARDAEIERLKKELHNSQSLAGDLVVSGRDSFLEVKELKIEVARLHEALRGGK